MTIHMDVRVEEVHEEGEYEAVLVNLEEKDTKYGLRLMWTFELVKDSAEVVGFTSKSPSTRAKAYQWAKVIMGEIDPKKGWDAEDVIGGECVVVLKAGEDAQGVKRNKVVEVKPPKKGKAEPKNGKGPDDPSFDDIPFS